MTPWHPHPISLPQSHFHFAELQTSLYKETYYCGTQVCSGRMWSPWLHCPFPPQSPASGRQTGPEDPLELLMLSGSVHLLPASQCPVRCPTLALCSFFVFHHGCLLCAFTLISLLPIPSSFSSASPGSGCVHVGNLIRVLTSSSISNINISLVALAPRLRLGFPVY